jgi:hypothetical protein
MTDAGENNPYDEGSDPVPPDEGVLADRRAAEDPTAQGEPASPPDKPLAYEPGQEHEPQAGEQGGQPNLSPDPAVAGRPSRYGQGSTDDSPGTISH